MSNTVSYSNKPPKYILITEDGWVSLIEGEKQRVLGDINVDVEIIDGRTDADKYRTLRRMKGKYKELLKKLGSTQHPHP